MKTEKSSTHSDNVGGLRVSGDLWIGDSGDDVLLDWPTSSP